MISRPPSLCRSDSFEIECTEIERIDKRVDHTDRIILVDPVVQTFRKKSRLAATRPLNEALHSIPRNPNGSYHARGFRTPRVKLRLVGWLSFGLHSTRKRTLGCQLLRLWPVIVSTSCSVEPSNSKLERPPTTPQDYPERSG